MNIPNIRRAEGSHWYTISGEPVYEVPKKSGPGMRAVRITDALEMGLIPSVTTVLKVAHKPELQDWMIKQAVKAVMTTRRERGESMEDFLHRVLVRDRIQDMEADDAAGRGSAIHNAISCAINAEPFEEEWRPYVESVLREIEPLGKIMWSEKILVGEGYAGKGDILIGNDRHLVLLDFKSTKNVPKESWKDHRMQTAAYAKTLGNTADTHVLTGNLYLSTTNPGEVNLCLQENWEEAYEYGFKPALQLWRYMKGYR